MTADAEARIAAIWERLQGARVVLDGVAHRTPLLRSSTLDQRVGASVHCKCEQLQRTGSFKFRGAYHALSRLDGAARRRGVITYSSGNHAQALAAAGRLRGIAVTVVMPIDAPAVKRAATAGYGAEIVSYDPAREQREAIGARLAADRAMTLIPPYDHADVMAGQGTAAAELIAEVGSLDVLLVCVGGGGLIAGSAVAAHHLSPGVEVVGVEPEAGDDTRQSLARGEIVHIATPQTIADGAQTQHSGRLTFPVIQRLVKEVVTVGDDQLVAAMRYFAERMKIVVEPTGCLAAAALLEGVVAAPGRRVGVIVSGGNIDLARYARLLAGGVG
jgi:threo-3-hydroxy-L-aspartate ammonia-lyase